MEKSVILCPKCRRVIAIGATLPATCLAAVPPADRQRLSADQLARHPAAHNGCLEARVEVPDNLEGERLLDAVMATHGAAFAALLATHRKPAAAPPAPATPPK
jgi:hypothetical protein